MQDSEKRLKQLRIKNNNENSGQAWSVLWRLQPESFVLLLGTAKKDSKANLKKSPQILFFLHHSFFLLTGIDFCQCQKKTILLISVTPNSGT